MLVGCLTSQQHASVSHGRICLDNFTCCHTEIQVADPTFYLTQAQYTDTGPTSPSADPITPGAWQGSHWSADFLSHWYDSTPKKSRCNRDSNPGPSSLEADALTTRPTRRSIFEGGPTMNKDHCKTQHCRSSRMSSSLPQWSSVACLTSLQQACVSQGLICCHTEIQVPDPTFHLTQSRYTDTGPTSPSTDPISPGAWQGSHWSVAARKIVSGVPILKSLV